MVTDIAVLVFPIPYMWKLQLPRRQKIILSLIFIIGSLYVYSTFHCLHSYCLDISCVLHLPASANTLILTRTCIISLYRLILLIDGSRKAPEFTHGIGLMTLWSYVYSLCQLDPPVKILHKSSTPPRSPSKSKNSSGLHCNIHDIY
jgi:hypothetical protein